MRQKAIVARHWTALFLSGGILLTGCSQAGDEMAAEKASALQAPMSADTGASADIGKSTEETTVTRLAEIPVSMPKIAYTYNYGFELPGEQIAKLQKTHADLCERQGPFACRIISMSHSGGSEEDAGGTLQLAVAAPKARDFGDLLSDAAASAGGTQVSATIAGEDLSKQMVDTEARLRARTVLRDRLLEVLRTRRGKVSELIEAERSVARVNEEIDQARSWLEEMRGRVSFSKVDIAYGSASASGGNFVEPIKAAFASVGAISGTVIGAVIMLLAILLPLGTGAYLFFALRGLIRRRFGGSAAAS